MNSNHPPILFYRQHKTTPPLTQNCDGDAGYDLHTPHNVALHPDETVSVNTEIHVAIPYGYVGIIKDRSGLALKHGVEVLGGVIDSNYRGPIKVLLAKAGRGTKDISPAASALLPAGSAVAQMVVVPCLHVLPKEVDYLSELGHTARGANGFGSSGR